MPGQKLRYTRSAMLARAPPPKLELVEAEIERRREGQGEKGRKRETPCAVLTVAPAIFTFIAVRRDPRTQSSKSAWITRSHLLRARNVDSPRILANIRYPLATRNLREG